MNHSHADTVLIELHYLPSIAYFIHLQPFRKIILEVNENYTKQTYRNRCYILTANKVQALSIPVSKDGNKTKLKEISLDYTQRWQNNHWRAIQSAYGKTPFFDFFADYFHDILYRKYKFLIDLNVDLLTKCLELLNWHDKEITLTSSYVKATESQWVDFRGIIDIKSMPPNDKIEGYTKYNQIFGKNFVSNLSVIDLLFCEGPNANMILGQSSLIHR
ncbi:WbqC family protein [Catalinimonas niigatensis]|uniref:WbqC family protein n=1 Tax=Catalinimonas niigatensis TaxID=1397264 RepID=UPI002667047A|nr:WbqC family protein [Catalinimonas niigatensis]WPP48693.1 WbqC family protein [Catalinimonas niigatensis]